MCYIEFTDKKPSNKRHLDRMVDGNPAGGGLIFQENGKWRWIKGLSSKRAALLFAAIDGPRALHLRFATAGELSPKMTHPFPTQGRNALGGILTKGSLIMHNGTSRKHADLAINGESDTAVMARMWDTMSEEERKAIPWRSVEFTAKGEYVLRGDWHETTSGWASALPWVPRVTRSTDDDFHSWVASRYGDGIESMGGL